MPLHGFLENFAYGASEGLKTKVAAEDKANADADARIREKVAEVQPMADLYQRQKDIDEATEEQKIRFQQQQGKSSYADALQYIQGGGQPITSTSPSPFTTPTTPAPTITTPSTTGNAGGFMTPNTTPNSTMPAPFLQGTNQPTAAPTDTATVPQTAIQGTTPPATADDAYKQMQVATLASNLALSRGDKTSAEIYKGQAEFHKQQYDYLTTNSKKEPVLSSEGSNPVDDIKKDTDTAIAKPKGKSQYLPDKLNGYLTDPEVADQEKQIAENIHAPLTQAFLDAKKATSPSGKIDMTSGSIKSATLQATKDIVTIKSTNSNITIDEKQKALGDLTTFMNKNFSQHQLMTDSNLHSIFDQSTQDTIANLRSQAQTNVIHTNTGTPSVTSGTPTVNTAEDYAKVPPGTAYTDPNGIQRTKPQAQ